VKNYITLYGSPLPFLYGDSPPNIFRNTGLPAAALIFLIGRQTAWGHLLPLSSAEKNIFNLLYLHTKNNCVFPKLAYVKLFSTFALYDER